MNIIARVKEIQEIKGYTGLVVLNNIGEIIYIDENKKIDLAFASSLFNDTFKILNEASLDMELSNLIRLETENDKGITFLIYSNQKHTIFTIFNPKGNISLAKIILTQVLKKEN